jgi:SNF2 family DNA or RNA helicase
MQLGYGFVKLDGSTKQSDSKNMQMSIFNPFVVTHLTLGMPLIDKFHSDPKIFVFLISTLAGGTGLNLTGQSPCL